MAGRDVTDGPVLTWDELAELFDRMADGVYAVEADGQCIRYWNDAAARITDIPRADVLGRHCYEVVQGTDYAGRCYCRQDCTTIECARRGEGVPSYDVLAKPGSRRLWINVSILPVQVAGMAKPVAVHIFRDASGPRTLEVLADRAVSAISGSSGSKAVPERPELAPGPLTSREVEVLRLLASGASVHSIAHDLVITRATVRAHIEHIMTKLDAHSRMQAVVIAANLGLL